VVPGLGTQEIEDIFQTEQLHNLSILKIEGSAGQKAVPRLPQKAYTEIELEGEESEIT